MTDFRAELEDRWEGDKSELLTIGKAIDIMGGLVCEQHPWLEFPHGDCAGPGMPAAEASTN